MEKDPFKALQERGIRVTPQRAHIWRIPVESGEHFTAEESWFRASAGLPGLELSTVYCALETLGEVGLVSESRLPEGPRVFGTRAATHPHLVCEVCGGISHPEPEVRQRIFEALTASSGSFEMQDPHVTARRKCTSCAGQGSRKQNLKVRGEVAWVR